jgi:hypothetical protein
VRALRAAVLGVALAAGACAPDEPASEPARRAEAARICPVAIEGATVDVEDTADGIALTFRTPTSDEADIRARAAHMARMYELHGTGMRPGRGPMSGRRGPGRGSMMRLPAVTASVEEVAGGARVVLVPKDPAALDALRTQVREHRALMGSGQCPMFR